MRMIIEALNTIIGSNEIDQKVLAIFKALDHLLWRESTRKNVNFTHKTNLTGIKTRPLKLVIRTNLYSNTCKWDTRNKSSHLLKQIQFVSRDRERLCLCFRDTNRCQFKCNHVTFLNLHKAIYSLHYNSMIKSLKIQNGQIYFKK